MPTGLNSWHWFVGDGLVLRRCNPFRSEAATRYEHEVLRRLDALGWPVAAPALAPDGDTLVDVHGCWYALFPRLRGRKVWPRSVEALERLGSQLAGLHGATSELVDLGARPDWPRLAGYASTPWPPDGRTFADGLSELDLREPILAGRICRHHEEVSECLLDVSGLPEVVVHGDFHAGNLLVRASVLAGVLDFDLTCLDLRTADIATTLGFHHGPEERAAIVRGYSNVSALADREVRVLPTLRRARNLAHAAHAMSFWTSGRDDMLAQVELAADLLDGERFPDEWE